MNNLFKRVIILGHTGFIGGNIYKHLQERNDVELMGFSSSDLDLTNETKIVKLYDLYDEKTVIIFCSARKRQLGDNLDAFKMNMLMVNHFCRLLEHQKVGRLIYFSSAAVYGEDIQHQYITEKTPVHPTSFYGIGKYTAERVLWKTISAKNGLSYIFLRPPTIYGPGDRLYPYGPSGFTHAVVKNGSITLWGDGSELREFIYIDDVVQLVVKLIFNDFQGVLNLASGKSYSFIDVLDCVRRATNQYFEVNTKPRSKVKVDTIFNIEQLRKLFPDFNFTPLHRGIELLFEYLDGNR